VGTLIYPHPSTAVVIKVITHVNVVVVVVGDDNYDYGAIAIIGVVAIFIVAKAVAVIKTNNSNIFQNFKIDL
jgi:hypothetical protein